MKDQDHEHYVQTVSTHGPGLATLLRKLRMIREPPPTQYKEKIHDGRRTLSLVKGSSGNFPKKPLGKDLALVLEKALLSTNGLRLEELAQRLGRDTRNGRYKLKVKIMQLLEAGLLEEQDRVHKGPKDIENRIDEELEISGCNEAHRLQAERYKRQQEAYHVYLQTRQEAPVTEIKKEKVTEASAANAEPPNVGARTDWDHAAATEAPLIGTKMAATGREEVLV